MTNWADSGKLWVFMGGVLMYAASRAAGAALVGGGPSTHFIHSGQAWRRAVGHWIPIAALAIAATMAGYGGVAVSIIFSTSVASLTLVVGSVLVMGPAAGVDSEMRRRWGFVAPVAMLTWLAGLTGRLHWWHALIFLAEGIAIALAWREMGGVEKSERAPVIGMLNFGLAVVLAAVGAVTALAGGKAIVMSGAVPGLVDSPVLVALGPLLVAPMLVTVLAQEALKGKGVADLPHLPAHLPGSGEDVAITMAVGVMLLNLCVLLPVVMEIWGGMYFVHPYLRPHVLAKLGEIGVGFGETGSLPFPLAAWRVDNVVLVLLGIVLIPAALGRLRLGRIEGFLLMGIYVMYLVMSLRF